MNYKKKRFGYCAVVIFVCFVLQTTTEAGYYRGCHGSVAEEMMKECLPYMTVNNTLTPSVDCCDKLQNISKISYDDLKNDTTYVIIDICMCILAQFFRAQFRTANGSSLPLRCSVYLPFDLAITSNCTIKTDIFRDPR
ncbi:hypothetical protein M5689_022838 [Euphorbia peplus]|nr:hypothetical protein M5689_022838 [Euphorbia peplus]